MSNDSIQKTLTVAFLLCIVCSVIVSTAAVVLKPSQEANKAHQLDKLSKRLAIEKDLSNTLLNNMLPKRVAEELRRGKMVEPAFHENVTLFFSDIVGFTSICKQVDTWDVIDMMNQLYSVMDFLASHFDLYKVETVGDAYM